MGRPALAVGGTALIGAGVAIAVGWWWPHTGESVHQIAQPIHTVRLDTSSGDVRISAADTTTTSVRERFHYAGSHPDEAYRIADGRLLLNGCGRNCTVDYELVVPRGTTITGGGTSGDVRLDGVAADVTSNSGKLTVENAPGPVKAHTTSGDIKISLSTAQDVTADVTSGDVEVTVPDDRYRVNARTTSGDQDIEVPTDPAALHVLDLQATSGDIKVRHD
ncbi:DUF4097 family beta strand repeat-containing protein [Amycolatopsis alkalitolerans]|uniref:DUF4097 domain-containing protein n=1 Tax=Amycolatopsis alkalitolerans TaxID=2547244 RepID=A0A5C4M2U0_9PSEU|nr:DUF4097 family beta strand repeat-containing protein [Amycolatopsis alkalitolerans]TNC26047.1 DUF4097 domain-containing protein [Amycolatopsis alkalitolerans]